MKKLTPLLLVVGLWAADAWQTKPFTEWGDKDVQKILTNSPWSKSVSVSAGSGTDSGSAFGRGGFGADQEPPRPVADGQMPGQDPGVPGGNVASRNAAEMQSAPTITLTVLWQSALPMKQALARRKYGAEAGTSPEAKKFLDENSGYLIAVSGIPLAIAQASGVQGKAGVLQRTTLSAKGKEPVRASEMLPGPAGPKMEIIFVFPKTAPFTAEDKDVEFSTQLGPVAVKNKFHLKEMVYHGTLEL